MRVAIAGAGAVGRSIAGELLENGRCSKGPPRGHTRCAPAITSGGGPPPGPQHLARADR
ncbi:hypothetical protein SALBM217S_07045 [Streptomyces griseoloalbus]